MKHVWYGVSLKVNATLVLSGFEQGMNTNTRRETPLPIYHRLLLGCFCCKSSGGYWDAMRSGDVARCCSIPLEECWQIYKLFLAQQRKVTRIFKDCFGHRESAMQRVRMAHQCSPLALYSKATYLPFIM